MSSIGAKGSTQTNKSPRKGSNTKNKRQPKGSPGLAHRTVRCATGQCPVHQGTQLRTCHLREFWEPLHYNSPDCPVCQRSNGYQGPTVVCRGTVKCYSARLRTQKSEQTPEGAAASEQDLSGAPPDYPVAQLSEAPTVEPNDLVTWLAHRTVRCTIRQQPPPTVLLVVGAINTPNHHTSKHPSFQPSNLIQEL
jgi:ribosomal protein L40E